MDAKVNLDITKAKNVLFDTSVAYGASATITGQVSCTFTPASGISACPLNQITVWGSSFTSVSTNAGAFPITLLNDGSGNSQVITFNTRYNNNYLHADMVPVSGKFYFNLGPASLSAGSTDTLASPESAVWQESNVDSDGIGVLSALGDAASPSGVTSFTANLVKWSNSINLTWVNPADSDLSGCYVRYSTTSAPSSISAGTALATTVAPTTSYTHSGLAVEGTTTYYYSIFSFDNVGKTSTAIVSASNTPYNSLPGSIYGETLLQTRSRLIDEGLI